MHAPTPTVELELPAAVVPSPAMSEHERGREARRQILAELARLYLAFEPPPTIYELGAAIELSPTTVRHHVATLRRRGHIHPTALWITRAGFDQIHDPEGLTN